MVKLIKKIIIVVIPFILFISIIILIIISNNKQVKDDYYMILENKGYVMKDNRNMYFTVYSKKSDTLINYKDENSYTLLLDNMNFTLEVEDISKFEYKDYYIYKLRTNMPIFNESFSSKAKLKITNTKFTLILDIGTISFLNPNEYNLISLDLLYASYSYINDAKMLVGINIKLTDEYKFLKNFKITNYANGLLSKMIFDNSYDYEIEINKLVSGYKISYIEDNYIVGLKSNSFFVPITYKEAYMIKDSYITFELDGIKYYIDTFSFMVNDLKLEEYQKLMTLGEIKYA